MYSSKEYQQIAKDNIDYLDILLKKASLGNLKTCMLHLILRLKKQMLKSR